MNQQNEEQTESVTPKFPKVSLADLPESLKTAVARAGWSELMPVQAQALPYHFAGQDLMVQSRTGSGKTGAYLIPLLEILNPLQNSCQALILAPTRELALQVSKEIELLGSDRGLRSIAVYGGVSYKPQLKAFKEGAHIVVGTPGRILDHLLKRNLKLDQLRVLIFDEADRLLSMGFFNDMLAVKRHLPETRVHSGMYSATFPPKVMSLSRHFLIEPELLSLSADHVHVMEVSHTYCKIDNTEKDRGLVRLIEFENPTSAIIFCNTRAHVDYVTTVLGRFGYNAAALSSDLGQHDREKVLGRLRKGQLRLLVATDVAARGIDIPELSHVFQYELPTDPELYIHRAGRTGRAGASGEAISLVDFRESSKLKRIARLYKIEFEERPLPSDEELAQLVSQRMIALLEARLRDRDRLQLERSRRFIPLAQSLGESEEELNLMAILLDDYYQDVWHKQFTASTTEPDSDSRDGERQRGRSRPGRRNRRR